MDALLRRRAMIAAGGGSPTPPGPTPELHARVRFDGTAYIQTDIIIPANGSVRVSTGGETRKGNQGVFNAMDGSSTVFSFWLNNNSNSSTRSFSHRYNSATTGTGNPTVSGWSSRVGVFLGYTKWGTSSTAMNTVRGSRPPTSGLVLASASGGYRYTGALGYVYIYDSSAQGATSYADLRDNYTPVYTLRPCTYDGEVGYWCVETSTFYGNSNTEGTLTVEDD